MYVNPNFPTKKALKEAVTAGRSVYVFQPGGIFPGETDGVAYIEGPHYPKPHSWYAKVMLKESRVVKVLS